MIIDKKQVTGIAIPEQTTFEHRGCENCNHGKGQDVYLCNVYTDISMRDYDDYPTFLCNDCLNAHFNAEPLPNDCQNKFNI